MTNKLTFAALLTSAAIAFSTPAAAAAISTADWQKQVRSYIQQNTTYPATAERAGVEGQLKVRIKVTNQRVTGVELLEASGSNKLDQHAISSLFRMRDLPALPTGVDATSVIVPVRFRIEE